jgi:hypothetical protein
METFDHQRLADVSLRDNELIDIEIVIVFGIGDCRFQALANIARHALAREFQVRQRNRHLFAANELRQKIELLRAHAQHARDSLRLVLGKGAFARPFTHPAAPYVAPAPADAAGADGPAAGPAVRFALRSEEWP